MALDRLAAVMRINAVSSLYETDPVGVSDQPGFLNLVLAGETELAPEEVLAAVKVIESQVGRIPTYRWGPRVIDVDILLYGDRIVATPSLSIPHPRMHERAFVLIPLAEIAGSVIHPLLGQSVDQLAKIVVGWEGVTRLDTYAPNRSSRQGSPSM